MSTYKEIRGLKVRDYTTNPDNPIEGQLWYNKTDNVAKYQIPNVLSSWRTGNNLNTARKVLAGAGTTTAALAFGGETGSGKKDETETWNGSGWTEVADLNTGRTYFGSAGTNTAALAFGGDTHLHGTIIKL